MITDSYIFAASKILYVRTRAHTHTQKEREREGEKERETYTNQTHII